MAIRADLAGLRVVRRLAVAMLACGPLLAGQGQAASENAGMTPAAEAIELPLTNLPGRQRRSLNGAWPVLIDPYAVGIGDWRAVWKDRTPVGKDDFVEYGFDAGDTLQVPGDFNSQRPELKWLEGSVWYRKSF